MFTVMREREREIEVGRFKLTSKGLLSVPFLRDERESWYDYGKRDGATSNLTRRSSLCVFGWMREFSLSKRDFHAGCVSL